MVDHLPAGYFAAGFSVSAGEIRNGRRHEIQLRSSFSGGRLEPQQCGNDRRATNWTAATFSGSLGSSGDFPDAGFRDILIDGA